MSIISKKYFNNLPLNEGVTILSHNEHGLIALDKPAGLLSHPNDQYDIRRALLIANYDYEKECYNWKCKDGENRQVWLINRLDSPTSGVILLGLNSNITSTIKAEFVSRNVRKLYYAIVRHQPRSPRGFWSDTLVKDLRYRSRYLNKKNVISAKTDYQFVRSPQGGFPISLLRLMPLTGRTHQLRIQCKKHGLPIVGDRTFGDFPFNREVVAHTNVKRMLLHSAETHVRYHLNGRICEFSAKSSLPDEFQAILNYRPKAKIKYINQFRS